MYDNEGRPMFHIYFEKQKGAALLRLSSYTSEVEGWRPAAWPVRDTAKWWARKLAQPDGPNAGERWRVFKCEHEGCTVCATYREYNPIAEEATCTSTK